MKRLITILLALAMVFSLAACSSGTTGGNKGGESAAAAATTTATGGVVIAELPEGWTIKNQGDFDFIHTSENDYFSVLCDTQDLDHYKEMIATGNYGKDLGTVELSGNTWLLTDKMAVGPIGDNTCVVQSYGSDLSSAEVQAALASLKWAK